MQPDENIRTTVAAIIERYSGRGIVGRDDVLVGGNFGITGWDAIDMVEEIEARYRIDLYPFFDARTTRRSGWVRSRSVVEDATVREFIQAVIDLAAKTRG